MVNKFTKYIAAISLSALFAINANADGATTHTSLLDGKNYFKIKAGATKPNNIGGNTAFNNRSTFSNSNTNYVIGAALGRKVLDFLFIDLEYIHFGKDKEKYSPPSTTQTTWNIQSDTLMANLRLNLLKNFEIMPYFKAGVGVSRNQSSSYNENFSTSMMSQSYEGKVTNSLAWQLGFGMSFEYNELLGTELEYTYVNRGDVKTQSSYTGSAINGINPAPVNDGGKNGTLKDNVITFGVRFKF